jgi:glycine hydroxymethyltransferase
VINNKSLFDVDPEVKNAITEETERQEGKIVLIASENYVSEAVLEATGSIMTNKYAEGYPDKRYYTGCEFVDKVEALAIERAKKLFGVDHANVQPHSGVQANMAVYFSILKPGDTILSMDLSHGGHLSHGSPVNFTGRMYKTIFYGVDRKTECIDYNAAERLAEDNKPKLIIVGASSYPREIDFERFGDIAKSCGALLMADIAHIGGLVVAGVHMSPIPFCDFVTVTTHKTMRGPRGGVIMCREKFRKDIDSSVFPGSQGGPLMHIIAAKAVSFKEAMGEDFVEYQRQIMKNTKVMAEELKAKGFRLVSGGTDNHLFLVDVGKNGLTGEAAAQALYRAGICANKNSIPFDTKPPKVTSGVRFGTPAVTTRGMKEKDVKIVAELIADVLNNIEDEKKIDKTRNYVREFLEDFPLYRHRLKGERIPVHEDSYSKDQGF